MQDQKVTWKRPQTTPVIAEICETSASSKTEVPVYTLMTWETIRGLAKKDQYKKIKAWVQAVNRTKNEAARVFRKKEREASTTEHRHAGVRPRGSKSAGKRGEQPTHTHTHSYNSER